MMKFTTALLLLSTLCSYAQQASIAKIDTANYIYRLSDVDQKPELPGGLYTLSMFMSDNFRIPDVTNKKIRLFVCFTVEKDGSMTDLKYLHLSATNLIEASDKIDLECDQYEMAQLETMKSEAVRVLSLFKNNWRPATKNGMPVRCVYNYPINFNIE